MDCSNCRAIRASRQFRLSHYNGGQEASSTAAVSMRASFWHDCENPAIFPSRRALEASGHPTLPWTFQVPPSSQVQDLPAPCSLPWSFP